MSSETEPRPDVPDELLTLAADAIRRYDWDTGLSANPDVSKHQRREAAAVLAAVAPVIERQVRERVAAEIRRAAAGRRHYAKRATEPGDADDYMGEAAYLEAAAEIAEESNPLAMCSLLPHELWTDVEHATRIARGKS